jgi:hypothetical protein
MVFMRVKLLSTMPTGPVTMGALRTKTAVMTPVWLLINTIVVLSCWAIRVPFMAGVVTLVALGVEGGVGDTVVGLGVADMVGEGDIVDDVGEGEVVGPGVVWAVTLNTTAATTMMISRVAIKTLVFLFVFVHLSSCGIFGNIHKD